MTENHTRYIIDNQKVCDYPERLGWELVKIDNLVGVPHCTLCSGLIMAHNKKEFEIESELMLEHNHLRQNTLPGDLGDRNPLDIFTTGLLLGFAFTLTFCLVFWGVFLQ